MCRPRSRPERHSIFREAPSDVLVDTSGREDYVAVVSLIGEHDLATAGRVDEALRPLFGAVLVDLRQCTFIDSTIIGLFVRAHRGLEREGHRLDLLAPVGSQPRRTLEVAGVPALLRLVG